MQHLEVMSQPMRHINWFAIVAIGIAVYGVWENRAAAFERQWMVAAVVGVAIIVGWSRDRSLGIWLVAASAALTAVLLLSGARPTDELRGIFAGVAAGALVGLFGSWLVAALRRKQ